MPVVIIIGKEYNRYKLAILLTKIHAANKPTVLLTYPDIFSPHDDPSH